MENSEDVLAKVLGNFPLPEENFASKDKIWLTLYLEGHGAAYTETRFQLRTFGWINLDEECDFSGFAYPKKEVCNEPSQVRIALSDALSVCQKTGIGIGLIDADTALDPRISYFHNLYKSN
jgi:hypothetical protein